MLEEYFAKIEDKEEYSAVQIGSCIVKNVAEFPNLEDAQIALFGLQDINPVADSTNAIRRSFYRLSNPTSSVNIIDLGDIIGGERPNDTFEALAHICQTLIELDIVPIFITQHIDLAESVYNAYQQMRSPVELSLISHKLPILEYEFLHRICTSSPNYLSNINALGFQAHYISPTALDTFENLNFGHVRLGELKQNIETAELYVRNSTISIIDINAVQHADAPGKKVVQPSGLTSEEICQIARYIGISDTNKVVVLSGYESTLDHRELTSTLCAHILWYYVDGFINRSNDSPDSHSEFVKYRCDFSQEDEPILFLKSKKTQRWWMQIDHPASPQDSDSRLTFPCSYDDYQLAANGETPQRYLDALKKLV